MVKNPPAMQETWAQSLAWEDPQALKQVSPVPQLLRLGSASREAITLRSPCITVREEPLLASIREKPMQQQRPDK